MTELLPLTVIIIGLLIIALLLFWRWPGWTGFPFLIIILWITIHAGVSPLIEGISEKSLSPVVRFMGISSYQNNELPHAIALVVLSYSTLIFGMLTVYSYSKNRWGSHYIDKENASTLKNENRAFLIDRIWKVSLVFFSFGVLCFIVVMYNLMKLAPILEWSSHRASIIFPSESHGVIYDYAFSLYGIMQIGSWGLLLSSSRNRFRRRLAIAASLLFPVIQIILGNRLSFIVSLYALVIIFHFGVRPLRKKHWFGLLIATFVGLFIVSIYRYNFNQLTEVFQKIKNTLLVPRSINEAVWALRNWPDKIPFFGGETTLHGLQQMFPTARLVETKSIWNYIVHLFYNNRPPGDFSHGGGIHFGFPVEQFIDFGYIGVIFIGFLYGLFFGCVYEWQNRQRNNPFLLLLSVAITVTLITGLEGKMPRAIGEFFSFRLLPIGIMALLSTRIIKLFRSSEQRCFHWHARLLTSLYFVVLCFLLKVLTGLSIFNYLVVFLLFLSYISSFFIIRVCPKVTGKG